MPDCVLSFLPQNQPRKVCVAKIKRKIIWGIQTAQGAEGEGTESCRLRGVLEFLKPGLGVGGCGGGQAERWNFSDHREQVCWSQHLGTAVEDEFQLLVL